MTTSRLAWASLLLLAACDDAADPPVVDALVSGGAQGFEFGMPDMQPPDAAPIVDALPPDMCIPACRGAECGPDGCGGECGTCDDAQRCSGGVCVAIPCPDDLRRCRGECVDEATDVAHCGGCNRACTAPEGGRTRCEDSACVYVCVANDGAPIEIDPQTDRQHCGACRNACEGACLAAQCVPADCAMVIERVAECLVMSDACPAVVDPAPLIEEGVQICTAPVLFGFVRDAVADEDCAAIVELVGDAYCLAGP